MFSWNLDLIFSIFLLSSLIPAYPNPKLFSSVRDGRYKIHFIGQRNAKAFASMQTLGII